MHGVFCVLQGPKQVVMVAKIQLVERRSSRQRRLHQSAIGSTDTRSSHQPQQQHEQQQRGDHQQQQHGEHARVEDDELQWTAEINNFSISHD
jgi:hypothetical protein